jgi:hypothetical protein
MYARAAFYPERYSLQMLFVRVWMHPRATEFEQNWLTGKFPKDFNALPFIVMWCFFLLQWEENKTF